MKINDQNLADFLRFTRRIPPPDDEVFTAAWKQERRGEIETLPNEALTEAIDAWQHLYDEADDRAASVRSRAATLLAAIAVLAGLATLAASRLPTVPWPWAVAPVLAILLVAITAFPTAFLALRAQAVDKWSRPHLKPTEAETLRNARITRAIDLYSAARRNGVRADAMVGYLRDAQTFALAMIVSLAILVLSITIGSLIPSSSSDAPPSTPSPTATAPPST